MSNRFINKISFITTMLFLLSLVTNLAAAEINMTMYVLPFKDVPANHWGTKDIIKLSQRGVVTGYNDAKFYPTKPVTQMEALLMAVRNRGVKAQLASIDQTRPLHLAVGDEVKLKLSAGNIAEIELVKAKQQLTLTGIVVLISPEKSILTIQKENNSLEAYPISAAVEIKISGLSYPQLSNVLVNDQAELVIEQGQVTAITIKDRSVNNLIIGTVAAIDTANKILTLKTEKNELKTFDISPRAEFLIDDRSTTSLQMSKRI